MSDVVPVHTRLAPSTPQAIDKVRRFGDALKDLPQTPFITEHLLHAGIYTRTVRFPAETALAAVLIKVGTVFIIAGSADIYSNDELIHVEGYTILPGSAGRKVAIVTHSEVAISMILTTTATTIAEAEKAFTDEYQLLVPLSETDKHQILITESSMSGIIAAAGITAAAGLAGAGMQMIGGKGGGGTQQQTTQQTLPPWVNMASEQTYQDAYRVSQELANPYSGSRVANMTPQMQELIGQLYNNVGATNPGFDQASAITNGLTGFNPSMINPQTLAGTDLSPYMNPYTSAVINPAMQQMEASRKQSLMQLGDQATQNRAFGGSRQGITEGVQNAASELQRGQFVGQYMGQNFNQAQQAATGDISRNMQAQQFNSQQGLAGAQFQGQMANQLAGLAAGRQANFLAGVQPAMAGQQMLNTQDQAQLDAARQYYEEQRQYPLQQIQIRQNALAQSPYAQGSVQTGPGPSTNPLLTGLGAAATTAGLLGTFGKMGGWGGGADYGGTGSGLTGNPASGYAQNAWYNNLAGSGLT